MLFYNRCCSREHHTDRVKSKNVLNKVVNVCGKVVGERLEHLSQLYERRVVRKARVIVDDNSHVLAKHYELLPSGR